MIKITRFLATAAVLFLGVSSAGAQKNASDADEKEIKAYRLTLPTLRKVEAVAGHLTAWVKSDPEAQAYVRLQGSIDSLRKKDELSEAEQARLEKLEQQRDKLETEDEDDLDDDATLAQMAAKIDAFKPAADALKKAGMTSREYIVFSFAMFEASAFAMLRKQGMAATIPKDVNAENVKFVEQNAALIDAIQVKMKEAEKGLEGVRKKRP